MVLGIIVAILLTLRLAKRAGISEESIFTSAFCIVIFGLIGARLVHVLDNLDLYSDDPASIFAFWEGGLAWYGGLVGGFLGGAVYARVGKLSLARLADTVAPGVILGLAIGRIGCTINGDVSGTPTSLPWGIAYTHPDSYPVIWGQGGIPLHPVAIYEIILCLAIFASLWWLRGRIKPDGSLFLIMVATYSFGRFFLSWLRLEEVEAALLGPLHEAHIISLVLFIGAVALLLYRKVGWAKPEVEE